MTTTLPRPIEPGDIKPGQRVRAEATHLGDLDLYELTVTSVSEDAISGRWVYLSPEHYTWTLLEDVPAPARPVGSHWRDPETGAEYVATDGGTYLRYVRGSSSDPNLVPGFDDQDDAAIARLTPIPAFDPATLWPERTGGPSCGIRDGAHVCDRSPHETGLHACHHESGWVVAWGDPR